MANLFPTPVLGGPPLLIFEDARCEVHQMVVGPMDNNVYVARCKRSGEALLIDAANEHEKLLELASRLGVRHIFETHGHWDHIQAVPQVRDAGYLVYVAQGDAAMLPSYDAVLLDEEVTEVGDLKVTNIATPGHTPGSMCFSIANTQLLFSGDTLFPGGPGNTSFEGGDFAKIIDSIDGRIFSAFDANTLVLPGHGVPTTVGAESPQMAEWIERGW